MKCYKMVHESNNEKYGYFVIPTNQTELIKEFEEDIENDERATVVKRGEIIKHLVDQDKVTEIRTKWNDKDSDQSIWKDKENVWDFMNKHFENMLKLLEGKI